MPAISSNWGYRPSTEAEYADECVIDTRTGERMATYVVQCHGVDVTGSLTAAYIGRVFGLYIPE